jgi:creatinine amidohydrolase
MKLVSAGLGAALAIAWLAAPQNTPGVALNDLNWQEAERVLTPSAVVVLPLGLASQQNGPHLKLDAGERLARYLAQRVRAAADVVIAPALSYHLDPAYLEYPGSTSLTQNTARDMTVEIVRSLAKYGPRRFYVLNTSASALVALKNAADGLAADGILLGYTDMRYRLANARVDRQQTPVRGVAHADEIETSMMLFVDPAAVDMRRAVREYGAGTGAMTRQQDGRGMYSASGVAGDPTLATARKGEVLLNAVVTGALEDIEMIRTAPLPTAKTAPPPVPAPRPQAAARPADSLLPSGCTAGEERAIRTVGERFSSFWRQMDALKLAALFTGDADIRHPDGTIEKTRQVIYQDREELFRKREYRGSVHPVALNDIRCLASGVAVADGKWELRMEDAPVATGPAAAPNQSGRRRYSGLCTLFVTRIGDDWSIEAWRYTVDPPDGTQPPKTLKQPGFIGRGGH